MSAKAVVAYTQWWSVEHGDGIAAPACTQRNVVRCISDAAEGVAQRAVAVERGVIVVATVHTRKAP